MFEIPPFKHVIGTQEEFESEEQLKTEEIIISITTDFKINGLILLVLYPVPRVLEIRLNQQRGTNSLPNSAGTGKHPKYR